MKDLQCVDARQGPSRPFLASKSSPAARAALYRGEKSSQGGGVTLPTKLWGQGRLQFMTRRNDTLREETTPWMRRHGSHWDKVLDQACFVVSELAGFGIIM